MRGFYLTLVKNWPLDSNHFKGGRHSHRIKHSGYYLVSFAAIEIKFGMGEAERDPQHALWALSIFISA